MVASFTHVFLLAEKILKSRSFVLNIYRKNVLAASIKLLTVRGEPFCGFVNIVDMKTMKPQRSTITSVILAITKTQRTSFSMMKVSKNCRRFPGILKPRKTHLATTKASVNLVEKQLR